MCLFFPAEAPTYTPPGDLSPLGRAASTPTFASSYAINSLSGPCSSEFVDAPLPESSVAKVLLHSM